MTREQIEALRKALVEHNDLLRSAIHIAKREGVNGEVGTTNWDAYYNRVAVVLKRHHEITNIARAEALKKDAALSDLAKAGQSWDKSPYKLSPELQKVMSIQTRVCPYCHQKIDQTGVRK